MFSREQIETNDVDTLERLISDQLGGYKIAVKYMLPNIRLFRGVFCAPRPNSIKRISYPRPEHVTNYQRVNRIGQPRFYCSVAAPAVFYELHAKQGDFVVLSEWEVMEPLWMYNLGFDVHALRNIGTQERNIIMRRQLTHAIPDESLTNESIRRKLSEAFTVDVPSGQEILYKQSIAINESFRRVPVEFPDGEGLPVRKKVAGTVYPSLKMRGDADNVVLATDVVDSSLRLRQVQYVKVEAGDEVTSAYTFLTTGIANGFSGDNIEWMESLGSESNRRCHIALENDRWVGRDGKKRMYDVH